MNAPRTRMVNTTNASSTHILSNSSGNISNPILDAKHGLSAKDDIAKPERAVTELVHGGSVKHPPRMTEHTKFKAYVGSSDTMVDKSTVLEGGAFGSDGGISFGPSGGNITFPTDQNIESDFRRRVKWRKPYPRGFADKNIESDFRRRVKWKSHQEGSRDCLIFHSMDWGVIMSSCGGILLHDCRWQSLAHQLGFGDPLIDVWGDVLPSTLALLKKDSDTTHKYQKNICCYTFSCGYCKSVAFSIDSIIGISSDSAYKTFCGLDIRFIILELLPYHDKYSLLELCFKMHGKYGPMTMQQSDHHQGNFDLVGVSLHWSSHLLYCHPQGHFDLVGVFGLLSMSHLPFSEMKSITQEYFIYDIIEFSAQDSATQLYIVMNEIFHHQLPTNIVRHHSSQDLRSGLRFVIYSICNDITSYRYGETLSHRLRHVIYLLGCLSCISHTLLNLCRLMLTDIKWILFRGTKEFVVVQMRPTASVLLLLWWIANGAMVLAVDIVTCMVTIRTSCTSWIHGESNFDSGTCDVIIYFSCTNVIELYWINRVIYKTSHIIAGLSTSPNSKHYHQVNARCFSISRFIHSHSHDIYERDLYEPSVKRDMCKPIICFYDQLHDQSYNLVQVEVLSACDQIEVSSEYNQLQVTDTSDNFHYQIVQVINLHDQTYYQITDTLSFENNYNISSYISFDRITAPVNFKIICSLMNWEFLWGAITLNWELSWGVITSYLLPSRGVSNLCEFTFVRCQECVQYLLLVLRTFKYSCLDEWETFHLSSARRMSDLISRRFFTFVIGLNITVRRD